MPYKLLGLPLALGIALFVGVYFFIHATYPTPPTSVTSDILKGEQSLVATNTIPTLPPIDERVGRLFMVGHWANTPVASTTALITKYHVGGVIIMSAPTDAKDIADWVAAWQAASPVPLSIAIDQEGGTVSRLKGSAFIQTSQPEITDPDQAYAIAKQRGLELAALGINTNFAPVLESSVLPEGFLYKRVFRDPVMIALLGRSTLQGYRDAGVTGVPKHYPGHEDEPTDSHTALPIIDLDGRSFSEHTADFDQVIALGQVQAIMTAHVLVPSIDPDFPATLSKKILTDELRTKQKYEGVIITDDMTMDAIDAKYTTAKASQLALQAGADLILFAAEPKKVADVIPQLLAAIKTGELSETLVNEHFNRIDAWLRK